MTSPTSPVFAEDCELTNGFGSEPISVSTTPIPAANSGRRTTKRWSFHNDSKPNLVERPSEASNQGRRRLSDITGVDGVHKEIDANHISPAQLYSTESGRLFHAGKICIVLAGLPGRGKTHLSVSLTRYLRWLGVKTHSFHLGDYRRRNFDDLDQSLFIEDTKLRLKIINECTNDMLNFFENDKGQVAIYDAVNPFPKNRFELHEKFKNLNIQTLFIESSVTDDTIIMKNMESAAASSPDYANWDYDKAYKDYSDRIKALMPYYIPMGDEDDNNKLSYIKFINFGERIELHNSNYGYLINKVVFFLMNSRIKSGSVFFARCHNNSINYSDDPPLDTNGKTYAKNLCYTLIEHLQKQRKEYVENIDLGIQDEDGTPGTNTPTSLKQKRSFSLDEKHLPAGADGVDVNSMVVWTSVKKRTIESTKYFKAANINVRHRIQLSQKNPGVVGSMEEDEIKEAFPTEYEQYLKDPYHHRFSRAESYHDLAIKIEPLILEMERMSGDVLIIADESVLRVFYGYLMASSCFDIPYLPFSQDEIIEIKFNAYANVASQIPIKDFSCK
ncbi:hypothetical protein PSN45_001312 [Yamadazyma tenuis]|uniref:Bifunctional 6-phosphofructo-2-kinase/fructose-2,6-bisphosphate 2-phosphatase n=1 Tax=Candida tenuis (strain ATCC 10573 / BCRC 21748 / CBS 615 / JCM 9827 / NBRC 10315 / NRRL Y-1498 / VKM Y-70) TaxID=590646 RepID=G3BD16_CANTC|nr:bifunctional 6-phosphofructo-2-kinase/fructose-2,6-bisphosphate 2-phosphatase [Yamadazyma tenuis ATCC 10573]EGV60894.1 bifunctional 6-phosphofructo-2-kinase/fructose-2,6-bisphosphate 2-phosphatase [Yamadazyma tenuis ATCC 10573]WEJ93835.1 hypothetical protein PSN45_001312 [Yamadazyma tenuis]